jgi:hypothetical protein
MHALLGIHDARNIMPSARFCLESTAAQVLLVLLIAAHAASALSQCVRGSRTHARACAAQGVEEVATQNTVLNAKAVLKGIAKCCGTSLVEEVEVVAAKFDLESGEVRVIKRGWWSSAARSFFYE